MQYAPLGIDYKTKKLLTDPLDEEKIAEVLVETSKGKPISKTGIAEKRLQQPRIIWSYLVHEDDPHKLEIIGIMKKLAQFRGMHMPYRPLEFNDKYDSSESWIGKYYTSINKSFRPDHILIVADPESIPFEFQAHLAIRAKVGRVCFDTLEELQKYVDKIVRLSKKPPLLKKEATFFATNFCHVRENDPTYYSYNEMVKPLSVSLSEKNIPNRLFLPDYVTKKNIIKEFNDSKSALIYVASHGVGNLPSNKQIDLTGAICCQDWIETQDDSELFTAQDIPSDEKKPFLEGSIFFQFSCFGFGTPKYNDIVSFSFKGNRPKEQISDRSLISAIPKKLLSHPRGPVAFIGHANMTYLDGFYDTDVTKPKEERRNISSYETLIHYLFDKKTLGTSMDDMIDTASSQTNEFSQLLLKYQGGDRTLRTKKRISKSFFLSHDSKNYFVFGDPATISNF